MRYYGVVSLERKKKDIKEKKARLKDVARAAVFGTGILLGATDGEIKRQATESAQELKDAEIHKTRAYPDWRRTKNIEDRRAYNMGEAGHTHETPKQAFAPSQEDVNSDLAYEAGIGDIAPIEVMRARKAEREALAAALAKKANEAWAREVEKRKRERPSS